MSDVYSTDDLQVNAVTAKIMQRTLGRQEDLRKLSVGRQPLQNVDHFKYPGRIISNDRTADRDITSGIQVAHSDDLGRCSSTTT